MPTAITNGNIKAAVTAWLANPIDASGEYGTISGWNTSAVTNNMSRLFNGATTFNDDISS